MGTLDIAGLLKALHDGGVDYVLIGGVALAGHNHIRATEDIDLVPDPSPTNLERLARVVSGLQPRLTQNPGRAFGERERRALIMHANLSLSTSLGELDIVQSVPGVPSYAQLSASAISDQMFGIPARVCGREHLVAMKRARGTLQDLADVEALGEDPGAPRSDR
jgi:hypothetical protein